MIQVREAIHEDLADFIRMARVFAEIAGEPFDRENTAEHVEFMLDNDNTVAFIAIDVEGRAVGICGGIVFPTFWDNSKLTATETWWFVDPRCRHNGVGTALMDALESWAREAGAWRLSMMLIEGISPGVDKMYENRGYAPRERTFVKEL